jgi:hypothetical protein
MSEIYRELDFSMHHLHPVSILHCNLNKGKYRVFTLICNNQQSITNLNRDNIYDHTEIVQLLVC